MLMNHLAGEAAESPKAGTISGCAFSEAELQAIRIGELDLRALRARRRCLFPTRRRDSATRLANVQLEALRALIVAAGSDSTGTALLDAYRAAIAAGIHVLTLQALIDVYWD